MAVNVESKVVVNDDEPLVQIPKAKRTFFFCILYGLFMIDFIARVGVNAIFPILQGDLNLTDSQVGSLASIVLLGMSVFVLPVSFLGEKTSPKKAITFSAFIWSIGSVLSGMASGFGLLFAARFFVGSGNAAYAPLSNSMITSMYKKSQWGKQIGFYNTAMTLGGAAGAVLFANLATTYGWRSAFYVVGGVSLVLTALSLLLPDIKKETDKVTGDGGKNKVNIKDALGVTFKNKALVTMCLGAGCGVMTLNAVGAWTAIYLVRIMDMTIPQAANLLGFAALFVALGFPLGGAILDKWYKIDKRCRVWMPAICFIGCAGCYILGFYFQNIFLILSGKFVYALGTTSFHAATQELVPAWFKSVSYGTYVLAIQFLGSLGPICAGLLSQSYGLVTALLTMQVFLILGSMVLGIAGLFYTKDYNRARSAEQSANCQTCPE